MKKMPHAGVVRDAYIEGTHSLQLERSDDVGSHLLRVRQRHAHHAIRLRPTWRPVLKGKYFQLGKDLLQTLFKSGLQVP